MITANYKHGMISTTIYSDAYSKQAALEQLGFKKDLVYHLMFRPSAIKTKGTSGALLSVERALPNVTKSLRKQN